MRYDNFQTVRSTLEIFDDLCDWVAGLRSADLVADLLRENHPVTWQKEGIETARTISRHADNALSFLDQAHRGPDDHSYLPLYYSILSLAKVMICAGGNRAALEDQRVHGIVHHLGPPSPADLLDEQMDIKQRGVTPLLYRTLFGEALSSSLVTVQMRDVYPYVIDIAHEYQSVTRTPHPFVDLRIQTVGDLASGFRLLAHFQDLRPGQLTAKNLVLPPIRVEQLGCFRLECRDTSEPPNGFVFVSLPVVGADEAECTVILRSQLRRSAFYHLNMREVGGTVAVCENRYQQCEELPIMLALFHMSSLVRYDPERFAQIRDSRYWMAVRALRRHAVARFIQLCWAYLHNTWFNITTVDPARLFG